MARGSAAEQQGRGRRIARLLSCACLLVAVGSVVALPPAIVDLDKRQLASSADADGNTVVYSVGLDPAGLPSTTTIETIEAAAAAATTTTTGNAAAGGNVGVGGQGNEGQSVNLGQQTASPTSQAPPTTYLAFTTEGGVQVTLTRTFTATTPSTPPPQSPMSGTVLPYTAYITNTATSATGSATAKKFSRQHGQVAAFGVLLSMLVGAIVVL